MQLTKTSPSNQTRKVVLAIPQLIELVIFYQWTCFLWKFVVSIPVIELSDEDLTQLFKLKTIDWIQLWKQILEIQSSLSKLLEVILKFKVMIWHLDNILYNLSNIIESTVWKKNHAVAR